MAGMSPMGTPMTAESLYGTPPSVEPQTSSSSAPQAPAHQPGTPQPTAARPESPQQAANKKFPAGLLHQPHAMVVALLGVAFLLIWHYSR